MEATDTDDTRLSNDSIQRYSRQLVLPEIGVDGQKKLEASRVLIVGAGGLGCPSAIYLAAAGVGHLGIVDYDDVELSNLHRQILHTESRVGAAKCESAATACTRLNSTVKCVPHRVALNSHNAMDIISQYDLIIDASDNVATRYLLNDACVLTGRPLISGSALRFEGQLTVYNYKDGPCYRCLYPTPPPPETVTNCSDGGVLGVVPGIIGSLQALETIKIITGIGTSFSGRMLLFDGLDATFRQISLRPRQPHCVVCGDAPSITQLIDYEQFCGGRATDKTVNINILADEMRLTCKEYESMVASHTSHLLLDVRPPVEYAICSLPSSFNIELKKLASSDTKDCLLQHINKARTPDNGANVPLVVVCKLGNDSQRAVVKLRDLLDEWGVGEVTVRDVVGGVEAWATEVDRTFPRY